MAPRIEKLEAADKRLTRRLIWEDGTGSAEREIARLEAVGELDGVELHIVHWQTDEAIACGHGSESRRESPQAPSHCR
jgi:hypothetical protein